MSTTLEANIHGRKFRLAAPDAESAALAEAIAILEAECAIIAQKQPTAEIERVLLLAALELAATKPSSAPDPRIESRLIAMSAKLETALAKS
jgi:cell division protein ZapA (FtsZ GTPase activity inhibitor)